MDNSIKEYMVAKGGLDQYYASIPELPPHIKEKLLTFNILQLCALVSEKPGPKWSGASDHYGPLNEIARRWNLSALAQRIEDMHAEEPLKTYARIMQVLPGGNPANPPMKTGGEIKTQERLINGRKHIPDDGVAAALANCKTLDDLKKMAKDHNIWTMGEDKWKTVAGLKNFGLQRMYVGNNWRALVKHNKKKEHNLDDNTPGMV